MGLLAFAWTISSTAADPPQIDLVGDWYVLIHYRDTGGDDPEQTHWDDEIWRFTGEGSELRWSLHPHLRLRDTTGRTEELSSGEVARTLGAWSPSEAQLAEIRSGVQADDHEARAKQLRGSPERGWRSAGALRSRSASMIGYHERWAVLPAGGSLVFSRDDVMGAGRTERAEGRTVFTTEAVLADGDELRGEYERDGRLRGRFRMIRTRAGGRR